MAAMQSEAVSTMASGAAAAAMQAAAQNAHQLNAQNAQNAHQLNAWQVSQSYQYPHPNQAPTPKIAEASNAAEIRAHAAAVAAALPSREGQDEIRFDIKLNSGVPSSLAYSGHPFHKLYVKPHIHFELVSVFVLV